MKRIGKLQLNKETMRHLGGGAQAGMALTFQCGTRTCPIESYQAACPTQAFDDASALDRGSL
jgi:hypothetical protein